MDSERRPIARRRRFRGPLLAVAVAVAVVLVSACAESASPRRVAVVEIQPGAATLLVGPAGGQSLQLTAVANDSRGVEMLGQSVAWSSPTPGIISVSATGLVQAIAVGAGSAKAAVGGKVATIAVTVLNVPVATLSLAPDTAALEVSPLGAGTQQLAALLQDSIGSTLSGRAITWSTTAAGVATVSPTGLVTAVGVGSATIRAVSEGKSDSVAVTVTATTSLPGGMDLSILDALWTQGAQTAEGSIPMLTGGRAAVLNVMTGAGGTVVVPIQIVLRLFTSAGSLYYTDTASALFPPGVSTFTSPTAQFLVPSVRLQPGMRWEVERDPRGVVVDASDANDIFPRGGDLPLDLITPPVLRLRFVPISLSAYGGVTGNVSLGNIEEYLKLVRTFMPHGQIEATVAPPFSVSTSYGTAPLGGTPAFWTTILPQIDAARVADPSYADAHWIGVVAPPAGFTNAQNGGWGYIPGNGTSFGPATRTYAIINVGWFFYEPASRELTAHELGHNLGRQHAPCGSAGNPDFAFPNVGGTIGAGATDTYAWELGLASSAAPVATSIGDVMGYCTPVWVSAYTYGGMLAFRGGIGAALQSLRPRERVILVQGHVEHGVPRIDSRSLITARGSGPSAIGAWTLEGRDGVGGLLFTERFELGRYGDSDDIRPFAVTVPIDARTERALASLRVTGLGTEAELRLP